MRLNTDICALSEIRLTGMGSISEAEYTNFWHSKENNEVWQNGVRFTVQNSLVACINAPLSTSECLMTLKLNMVSGQYPLQMSSY